MTVDLSGKYALITGASRGIGAAVAKAYAKAGAHVILLARTVGGLEEVDDAIKAEGGQATLMPLDLRKLDEIDKIGPTIAERFGALDIFVGNAGMLGTLGPLPHSKAKEWQQVMDINVNANFRLIRTLDPLLRASSAGRAIFVTSGIGNTVQMAYWGSYAVSKAALRAMAMTYAEETRKTNLRVNMISPGPVETAMLNEAFPGKLPEATKKAEDTVPAFLDLASPDCVSHGEMIDLD
jgi:NAD(P)-dependent dehydrogenase (short-subunit alcohol dehydrogenase family)